MLLILTPLISTHGAGLLFSTKCIYVTYASKKTKGDYFQNGRPQVPLHSQILEGAPFWSPGFDFRTRKPAVLIDTGLLYIYKEL